MGCGSSSSSGGHKKKKIDFDMERTRVHEFDSVFEGVAEPLATLLDTRNTMMKGKRELEEATGTRKRLKDGTFTDTVMGMLFCYSASTNGNLSELDFHTTKHAPYFNVKKSSLRPEFQKIPNAFEYFLEKLAKVPEKLAPLAGQIKDAAERCAGQIKDGAVGSNLNPFEKVSAVKAVVDNVAKLTKAPEVLNGCLKLAEDITKSLIQCAEMLLNDQSTMETIKTVGKNAHKANCFKPEDIVGNFWPDKTRVLPPTAPKQH